jgi:hypothetical protein
MMMVTYSVCYTIALYQNLNLSISQFVVPEEARFANLE